MNKRETGRLGEDFATSLLQLKGYTIIARNYTCRFGEIDIVAIKEGENRLREREIHFIEVKLRNSPVFGYPAEAVTGRKQLHMRNAALNFLRENREIKGTVCFDVIEIGVNHIENAF